MYSETAFGPREEARFHGNLVVPASFARDLERELTAAKLVLIAERDRMNKEWREVADELSEANKQNAGNERWMREVLTDFRIPFDDHLIGRRIALAQWMADKMKGTL